MDREVALRILDANSNRAREALRVAEDYARFALDSPRLASRLKSLRHDLRQAIEKLGVPGEALLAARDTTGDVGTDLSTEPERRRSTTADVAQAALKRLEEALRSLEEYAKLLDPEVAASIERLRYRAYELELQLFRLPRGRLARVALYVVLSPLPGREGDLAEIGLAALRGGAHALQLRHKGAPDGEVLALARRLRDAAREHDALLIVNDRPDIALLADADGVHLGADDLPIRAARRLLGHEKVIGATANAPDLATEAEAQGADYVGCGAVFPSPTRPDREVVGAGRVAEVAAGVRLPVFAIGGITLENLSEVLAAGCRRVAVCGAIVGAEDPEGVTREFVARLGKV